MNSSLKKSALPSPIKFTPLYANTVRVGKPDRHICFSSVKQARNGRLPRDRIETRPVVQEAGAVRYSLHPNPYLAGISQPPATSEFVL
ncbi:hypothetical protein AVEN_245962-1 [Araneus ventricosus]|uniref:Uncharacterized protein n=1 Tax=Araneus ventricosus TaxID=182803 RepID=A0A4Y2S597_ARAVE|nr:hypothetical protein AVEN_245962-1 [Araneus ventricosus]